MVACRCPHGTFSPLHFWSAYLAFADTRFQLSAIFPEPASRSSSDVPGQIFIIKAARLFDGDEVRAPGVCVVQGDRILSLMAGDAPATATVIDLGDATLMPGLIDCHTHVTGFIKKSPYEALPLTPGSVADSVPESALLALKNAATLLSNGFTTIRDVGSFAGGVDVALRNAIDKGLVTGPRMLVATRPLSITGGHGDSNDLASWLTPDEAYKPSVAHGPYGFRELVRANLKKHADCIKIMATGGVLSFGDAWDAPQMNLDEIAAVTDEAHKFGLRVAAHAHGDRGISTAVAGGCDSIEHATGVGEATVKAMRERGTYLVPTAWAADSIRLGQTGTPTPAAIMEKAQHACALRDEGIQRALAGGVRFAYGTDCGVFPHEQTLKDFEVLAKLGMAPIDLLKSATSNAAALIGKKDRGRIAPDLLADVVAFAGDPTNDISAMQQRPSFIMLGGKQLA
jgi:imidazolonepropionase-like amidohydrolase